MQRLQRHQPAQIMVLFGLSVFGLVAMVALVLDGGNMYLQRRTAQNAADAAALAGTRSLLNATSSFSVGSISSSITTFATANAFGNVPTVPCAYFVDTSGAKISGGGIINNGSVLDCPSTTTSIPNSASGVHVDAQIQFRGYLLGMLNIGNLRADGHATAQVGLLMSFNAGNTPLIVCGGGGSNHTLRIIATTTTNGVSYKSGDQYYVTTSGNTITAPSTLPTFNVPGSGSAQGTTADSLLVSGTTTLDTSKDGYTYYLKGSAIGNSSSDCGSGSNKFDGGVLPGQTVISLPANLTGSNGNNVSAIGTQVATPGGCQAGTSIMSLAPGAPGCVLILPIANGATSSNPPILTIVATGAFYVWCNAGSGSSCNEFVGQFMPFWKTSGGQSQSSWTFLNQGGLTLIHLTA